MTETAGWAETCHNVTQAFMTAAEYLPQIIVQASALLVCNLHHITHLLATCPVSRAAAQD